jgi:hypothetical protein
MPIFEINCLLLNEDKKKVFTVKISDSENVSILKELIKAQKARHRCIRPHSIEGEYLLISLNIHSDAVFIAGDTNTSVSSTRS